MTNETAIAILSELKKCYLGEIVDALDYAIEALKAQEPVKPILKRRLPPLLYACPKCGSIFGEGNCYKQNYCMDCGQAVKWE